MSEDIKPVKIPLDTWEDEFGNWSIVLFGPLRIQPNHYGAGLAMTVDRGIPCAEHTQIFSAHSTDTPEKQDVLKAIEEHGAEWKEEATAFIGFLKMFKTHQSTREAIAAVFFVDFIGRITAEAYQHYGKRYWEGGKPLGTD